MFKQIIVGIVFSFFAVPASAQILSPPSDDIVGPTLEAAGWTANPVAYRSFRDILEMELFIRSKRMDRSGIEVWESTQKFGRNDLGGAEIIKSYMEIISVPGPPASPTLKFARPLSPEEVARRRAANEGENVGPDEAMAVGLQAYGEGLLLVGGTMSQLIKQNELGSEADGYVSTSTVTMGQEYGPGRFGNAHNCLRGLGKMMAMNFITDDQGDVLLERHPWESTDPFYFLMGPACMVFAVAERMGVDIGESAEDMLEAQRAGFESAEMLDVVEEVIGEMNRPAVKIEAKDLNLRQQMASREPADADVLPSTPPPPSEQLANSSFGWSHNSALTGTNASGFAPLSMSQHSTQVAATNTSAGVLTINKMSIWIDAEYFVRLKTRMEGVIEQDGESREIFLEREFKDYQTVPGTYLYEPYREVLRVGGLMSPAQQAELQEAAKKLDEYERQMASMPASQRAMMEKMMGSKMDQFRSMASGGAMEMELITTSFNINPDFSSPSPGLDVMRGEPNLVQIVQQHLATLGYDPGKPDGELTKQTVVAISKYQAANGMEVTGQATPQLAGILSAAVDALH